MKHVPVRNIGFAQKDSAKQGGRCTGLVSGNKTSEALELGGEMEYCEH